MTIPPPLHRAAEWIVCVCICAVVMPISVLAALVFVAVVIVFAVLAAAYHAGRMMYHALRPAATAPTGIGLDGRTCETCGDEATHFVRDGIVRLDVEGGWITRGEGQSTLGPLRAFCRDHARPPRAVFDPPTASGGDPATRRPDLPRNSRPNR